LILACFLSSGRQILLVLVNYFVYVQLYGVFLECFQAYLLFVDTCYYRLSLFGVDLCIGKRYLELIVTEELVDGVDFACTYSQFLCFIKYMKILRREDAIKAGLIIEPVTESIDDINRAKDMDDSDDIEMNNLKIVANDSDNVEANKDSDRGSNVKVTLLNRGSSKKGSRGGTQKNMAPQSDETDVDATIQNVKSPLTQESKPEPGDEDEHEVSYDSIYKGDQVVCRTSDYSVIAGVNPLAKRSSLM